MPQAISKHFGMDTIEIDQTWLDQAYTEKIINSSRLKANLPGRPERFFRHGWQSWTLTTWLDPKEPPIPIRAPEFRAKDEDPPYAFSRNHSSAWVGAVDIAPGKVLLLGALGLSGRLELDGTSLVGFYESGEGEWLVVLGSEDEVFSRYTALLKNKFGATNYTTAPRVWCSWYSLYKWINESAIRRALQGLEDLPFDVFQLDDGWQVTHGDWVANSKFPSGMPDLAARIAATGRIPGIWIAPFIVTRSSSIVERHPDWLLRDETGRLVPVGITWEGNPYAINSSHPEVLEWLHSLIRKVHGWGFQYLKLDFLYSGALPGRYINNIPREQSYRNALQVIRAAAGDAYILACGAPIIPSLGLVDGLRIGPDVSPFWVNKPLTVWLNNPNDTSTQNAIRTSLHRLWLNPLVNTDPDVIFFRTKFNWLKTPEKQLLADLGSISNFRATSDLPQWLDKAQKAELRQYLEATPQIQKISRYVYQIDGRKIDFSTKIPLQTGAQVPVWIARNLGLLKIIIRQALPALWESRRYMMSVARTVIAFLQTIHLSWLP